MMPTEPQPPASGYVSESAPPLPPPEPELRWYHKISAVIFITFLLEIGLFLIIYPWTGAWENNYFSGIKPEWHQYWDNMYVRGGLTGLGVVNLYISLSEVLRLRRFARH